MGCNSEVNSAASAICVSLHAMWRPYPFLRLGNPVRPRHSVRPSTNRPPPPLIPLSPVDCLSSPKHGGFGLKSWFESADAAFLASYLFSATVLTRLFPYMKAAFVSPSTLPATPHTSANPIYIVNSASFPTNTSPPAVFGAITRLTKCTRNNEATLRVTNGHSLRQIQADLSVAIHLTNQASVITQLRESKDPRSIQHLAHFISQCHDIYTWSTCVLKPP